MKNNYRLTLLYKLQSFDLNVGTLCFLIKGSKKLVVHFELAFWFVALLNLDNTFFVEPYLIFNFMLATMVKSYFLFMEVGLY